MYAFWLSLGMIFLAELGDKTQLVALSLATRYNARTVLAGVFVATLLVHLVSVALGAAAGHMLPQVWISFIAGLAFIFFGLWTLRGDSVHDDGVCKKPSASPFMIVAVTFFLAELGDKTMLSTVSLATEYGTLPVWLGSTLGMVVSDGLAIAVGQILGKQLPEKAIKIGAACIFFGFGFYKAIQGGIHLPYWTWIAGAMLLTAGAVFILRQQAVCRVADGTEPSVEAVPDGASTIAASTSRVDP